ncbi:hypothetical protein [Marinobacter salicampi]|uniref:hypothetical protein n=1 Tax=Marinobacter salicampi TaxID=435907 RepID=UPI00140E958F|nr:hypothetical protein [Marinobacter salicampi]
MTPEHGSGWPPGTIIRMYDEELRIRVNRGDQGVVEDLNGDHVSSAFYWVFHGDKAELVALPESKTTLEK